MQALELVPIEQDTHCLLQEIDASEEIGKVQKLVDLLFDLLLLLNDHPVLRFAVDEGERLVSEVANVARHAVLLGLDPFKIAFGEPDLEEVRPEVVHEKEDCEDRGENPPHIRKHVHQLQIGTVQRRGR